MFYPLNNEPKFAVGDHVKLKLNIQLFGGRKGEVPGVFTKGHEFVIKDYKLSEDYDYNDDMSPSQTNYVYLKNSEVHSAKINYVYIVESIDPMMCKLVIAEIDLKKVKTSNTNDGTENTQTSTKSKSKNKSREKEGKVIAFRKAVNK